MPQEATVFNYLMNFPKQKGFTLVELLIVVSIIGILTGVTVSVVNVSRAKNVATDAVRQSSLEKLVQGLEAYNAAEGTNPLDNNSDGNALNTGSGTEDVVGVYVSAWPTDATYYYAKITENSKEFLCLSVPMATDITKYIKYVNPYSASETGGNSSCGKKILRDCTYPCSAGSNGNNIGDCKLLDGGTCL